MGETRNPRADHCAWVAARSSTIRSIGADDAALPSFSGSRMRCVPPRSSRIASESLTSTSRIPRSRQNAAMVRRSFTCQTTCPTHSGGRSSFFTPCRIPSSVLATDRGSLCLRYLGDESPRVRGVVPPLAAPALADEPCFERSRPDLRVLEAKPVEVGPVALLVEPPEHLVELLAQEQPGREQRKAPERHRAPEHPGKRGGDVQVGELVSGDLQRLPDEATGLGEGQRGPLADVLGRDELNALLGPDGIEQPAPENPLLHRGCVVGLHEGHGPENRRG